MVSVPLPSVGNVTTVIGGNGLAVGTVLATSTGVSGGVVVVNFKPVPIHYGTPYDSSFTVVANDGQMDSSPLTVTFNVNHINHPPTISANPSVIAALESLTPQTITFYISASDVDIIDTLTLYLMSLPSFGSLAQSGVPRGIGSVLTTSGGFYPVDFIVPALTPALTAGSGIFVVQADDGHVGVNLTLELDVSHVNFPHLVCCSLVIHALKMEVEFSHSMAPTQTSETLSCLCDLISIIRNCNPT